MIAARVGTFDIAALGGLGRRWPVLTGVFVLAAFSSLGLPGLNGFVGEFLILLGAFRTQRLLAVIATFGVLLAAIYVLRLFRRTMFGSDRSGEGSASGAGSSPITMTGDLSLRELGALLPLLVLIVWIGVFPSPFLQRTEGAVRNVVSAIELPVVSGQPAVIGAELTELP